MFICVCTHYHRIIFDCNSHVQCGTRMPWHIIGCIQPSVRCVTTVRNEKIVHTDASWRPVVWSCKKTWHYFPQRRASTCLSLKLHKLLSSWASLKKSKSSRSRESWRVPAEKMCPSKKTCPFKEVYLLWMCGVLCWPVLVLCQRQPQAVVLQWSSASGVQESGVRLFGAGVLYEEDGNLAILMCGDKKRWYLIGFILLSLKLHTLGNKQRESN